jgi:cbb3-type cytochrome oxidase maturation protein
MPAQMRHNNFTENITSMGVMILLLVASILVASTFLMAFLWSVKHHQFDDEFSSANRILFDDKPSDNNPSNI